MKPLWISFWCILSCHLKKNLSLDHNTTVNALNDLSMMDDLTKFGVLLALEIPAIFVSILIFTYFVHNRQVHSKIKNHGWLVLYDFLATNDNNTTRPDYFHAFIHDGSVRNNSISCLLGSTFVTNRMS